MSRRIAVGLCAGALTLVTAMPATAAPVLTRVGGNGTWAMPVAGSALASPMNWPMVPSIDRRGNLYVADNGSAVISKITPDGTLSIIAGTGVSGAATPGPATSSRLGCAYGTSTDATGNLYISDWCNHQVQKVTPAGVLSIVAGTGTPGAATPGPATSSRLTGPTGTASDSAGNLYIADDQGHVVLKVDPNGTLSIFAGTGNSVAMPTPGPATSSDLGRPFYVAVDSQDNVYINDNSTALILKVTPGGALSIVTGIPFQQGPPVPGPADQSPLRSPDGIAVDPADNLYVSDRATNLITRITPGGTLSVVAGDGTSAASTYGGDPLASGLNYVEGLTTNGCGSLFLAQSGHNTVDRIGEPTPCAPGRPDVVAHADGIAQLTFLPSYDWGTSAVTGYEASTDGGLTWRALVTAPTAGGERTATLPELQPGATYTVLVRTVNASGPGTASQVHSFTVPTAAPAGATPPDTTTTPVGAAPVASPVPKAIGLRLTAAVARRGVRVTTSGRARVPLTCTASRSSSCTSSGVLSVVLPTGGDGKGQKVVVGRFANARVVGGRSMRVTVRLDVAALRSLQRHHITRVPLILLSRTRAASGRIVARVQRSWLKVPAHRALPVVRPRFTG